MALSTSLGSCEPISAENCSDGEDFTSTVHSFVDALAQKIQNVTINKVATFHIATSCFSYFFYYIF